MNADIVQRFLVLAGELSYIEQAPATHALISEFLDICRHCDSKAQHVSLYAELEIAKQFVAAFRDFSPLFADISIENSSLYKDVVVQPGIAVRFLYHLTQDSATRPAGCLVWDQPTGALQYRFPDHTACN